MQISRRALSPLLNFFLLSIGFVQLLSSCKSPFGNTHPGIEDSSIEKGKELAAQYCQSCHLLPDPSLLDKKSWDLGVLPGMGPRLGIFYHNGREYPSAQFDLNITRSFYPDKPLMQPYQWQHILDYYAALAPDSLPGQNRPDSIQIGLSQFTALIPQKSYGNPASCLVAIDSSRNPRKIMVCDVLNHNLYRFNDQLQLTDSIRTPGPIVDIDMEHDLMTACNIGILNPNNGKKGSAMLIHKDGQDKMNLDTVALFDNLARPVQILRADLNQDGRMDYLVCEFGNLTGALSWMENTGDGKYTRHLLRAYPGAIRAYIQDANHDGLPDIWVLFAQGEEGIFLFTNKGHGQFDQQEVLRFPPVYGSSYFELDDFNKDGFPDILYTCGDNADYSPVLKPYHGVYIYLNDGKNHFTQKYFFPINGCYKAVARDFDGDGDLDIATIAFFADFYKQPQEGFVYLENKGDMLFKPYSMQEIKAGRWLTMNVGDYNGDGKPDIILGNFSVGPGLKKSKINWKTGPPFMILKNTAK